MKKSLAVLAGLALAAGLMSFIAFGRSHDLPEGWRRVEVVMPVMPEQRPAPEPVFLPAVEKDGMSMQVEISGEDSDHAYVHVSERLTDQSIVGFSGPAETSTVTLEPQPPLVKDLFAIKGVTRVYLYQYKISIEKGQRFDWDKLGPQITEVVFKNLGRPSAKK